MLRGRYLVAASGKDDGETALLVEEGVAVVVGVIERLGLRVSPEKTKVIWFHGGRKKRVIPPAKGIIISVEGKAVQIGERMKYLGLVLDGRWTFEDHFEELTPRLQRTGVALCRLLSNIGGPDERVRRLYAVVIRSMALYGAPVWVEELMARKKNRAIVASVWRRVAIRIVRGYRTLSHEAAAVLAGLPPMDLLPATAARTYGLLRRYRGGNPGSGPVEFEELEEKKREI